jgi:hypothetical protein
MGNKRNVSEVFHNNPHGRWLWGRPKNKLDWTVLSSKKTRRRRIYAQSNAVARSLSRSVYTSSAFLTARHEFSWKTDFVAGKYKTHWGLHIQCSIIVPDFNQIWILATEFCKSPVLHLPETRCPVGAALIHADRGTNRLTFSSYWTLYATIGTRLKALSCVVLKSVILSANYASNMLKKVVLGQSWHVIVMLVATATKLLHKYFLNIYRISEIGFK